MALCPPSQPDQWTLPRLIRAAMLLVNDLLRYQRRPPVISLDELSDDTGVYGAGKAGMSQAERYLLTLIDQLPTCHRDVLLIVDVQRYTCAEAAQLLELPLSTIIFHLSQARVALRDQLVAAGQVSGWSV